MTRPTAQVAPGRPATSRLGAAIAELGAAVSFLTRLPVGRAAADLDRTGAAAFALVGAAIGLVGAAPLLVLGPTLPLPAAVVALVVVAIASGGLHLDGLADTADALAAPTAAAAERARTDPRAGAAGVAAIVLDLLLGSSFLAAIVVADTRLAATALVVAATASRAVAPVAAWTDRWRRTRRRDGLGGWFASRIGRVDVAAAIATTIAVIAIAAVVAGGTSALGAAVGLAVAGIGAAAVVDRRGQLDGDGFGAIVEIAFVAILAGVAIVGPR